MLKSVLFATAAVLAAPALAQDAVPAPAAPTVQETPATQDASEPVSTPEDTQTATTPAQPAPAETAQTAPAAAPATASEPAQTAETAPATPAPAQTAETSPAPATPAQPAPAETAAAEPANAPAASAEQVAQAVNREFASYDRNKDGNLDKGEFSAWMSALRKASEPTFQSGSPEATAWVNQAFTVADADKSAAVNESELTTFLTPKPS